MSQKKKIKIVLKSNGETLNINNNLEANKKKELKMSQRFLEIKNFKNIGITKEEDQWERLYLNNSLDKDKIGELIILIGENNVGKSNILDAIRNIKKSKDKENLKNYIPDFKDYRNCNPKIKLVYRDNNDNKELELQIDKNGKVDVVDNLPKHTEIIKPKLFLDKVKQEIEDKFNAYTDYIRQYSNYWNKRTQLLNTYNSIESNKNIETKYNELKRLYMSLQALLNTFINSYNEDSYYHFSNVKNIEDLNFIDLDSIAYTEQKEIQQSDDIIKEKYGIDFIPNIIYYEAEDIKDEDLTTTPEDIKDSKFFNSLFKAIGEDISIITEAYEQAEEHPSYREPYEKDINKKLEKIVNKKFNELYFQNLKTQAYNFYIKLNKDEIYLTMEKNGNVIVLSKQSVGFKWFFNFFFNFLYTDELKAGDIVLMDEPEIHLSIPGRRDLRKFIKNFAIKSGITFITTTHNPEFIDINYLDELRIIRQKKNGIGVKIENDFSAIIDYSNKINDEDTKTDTLEEIISSFGVKRVDITKDDIVIFVEGITDYNYLTAFKLLKESEENKKSNLVFIPVGGLGGDDAQMLDKLYKLVQFKNAVLLTDGDTRGEKFKKLCEDEKQKKLIVIPLSEIKEAEPDLQLIKTDKLKMKNQIENLFSESDIDKYLDMLNSKKSWKSSLFKKNILKDKPDEKTIENFNKVLNYIIKIAQGNNE